MMRYALVGFVVVLLTSAPGAAQDGDSCTVLCAPELKIEPTISFENLGSRARVEADGVVEETERETVFELLFAVGVPTQIPRVGLTFEAGWAAFSDDNLVELELELNLHLIESDHTGVGFRPTSTSSTSSVRLSGQTLRAPTHTSSTSSWTRPSVRSIRSPRVAGYGTSKRRFRSTT